MGAKLGQAPGPPPCLTTSPASNPQILPQEEDYGFDIEEKNKAVVVKSVQRGSLAEVRRLRGAPPAPLDCVQTGEWGTPPPAQKALEWQRFLLAPCPPGETESESLGTSDGAPEARLPSQRVPPAPPAGPMGAK